MPASVPAKEPPGTPEANAAMMRAVAGYEPEATAAVIASPKQLLSVLLEAARRGLETAAPFIAAAAWREGYGHGRDDEAADLPLRSAP